ncbi:NACHT domain- and WD repeat-containing protein 1-like isoform X2 [Mizuhopecten yessoensis]|uniref:NACHT domain- and WD repeat-containing protein 1-like isoform X2 n=1 Tax=Mizuhopecten yessoensis TaxID=6573 RepID=UPI000B45ADBB|nr:NACHT domain- and WD repeat-containing protein 1-like isoform X2 [Mizuhopecten yessoensis]
MNLPLIYLRGNLEVLPHNPNLISLQRNQKRTSPGRNAAAKAEVASSSIAKEGFDRDAEQKFERMIEGQLDNIPNIPRSVVRIFISSTFSDMRAERNAIVREATPKLREFCAEHDLDFQMVDMRWGVTDDSQNDHSVEKICLMEVENCQKISLGPNFVLIKGSRYGFRPIPIELSPEDFTLLTSYITNPEHTKLLQTWYQRDNNSKPPQYVLQPIRSQFTFYGDYSPGCDEPRAKDTENWQQTFEQLQLILREAAKSAAGAGKMSASTLHEYFQSVTETEIKSGILDVSDQSGHTMVYSRSLTGLDNESVADKDARRYIEIKDTSGKLEVDTVVKSLRDELLNKIKKTLKGTNCREYEVPWISGGIEPNSNEAHAQYIESFCHDFLSDMKVQIKDGMTDYLPKIRFSEWYTDYVELIHHLQFCNTKCETFCGQTDVLNGVRSYILTDTSRKPLVLHAPSGAGKTSVMAMIMKTLPSWFKKQKHVKLIRFLGTSPLSTNIYDVLFGVCGQLADHAEIIMEPVSYKNMKNLLEYVPRLLRRVASAIKSPIVILLDSLDQLTANHDAHSLAWLPTILPSNVKLILSTLPEEHGILDTLRDILPNDQCYIAVPPLSMTTGKEIISKYLGQRKRTVTDNQLKLLMSYFTQDPGPLYLKLLLDEAVKWNSYTPEHEYVLANAVRSAISQLFKNLETKFGEVFTNHALGYITIAMNGVSETEMEDVLSCDDEVLNNVYRYHNPPVEGIVRIPPVLWARLRYDLKEYLVERQTHNKYTLNWYHRQFIEAGRAMYTQGKAGQKLHTNFSEIFMSQSVKRTIELDWRKTTIENADRQITPQAMVSKNRRMLCCLPYYINNAKEMISSNLAKEKCFCNFHFLKAKVAAFPLTALQEDLTAFVDRTEDEEVQKLRYFFSVCKIEDLGNSEKFAVSLLAKISLTEGEANLERLLAVALEYLQSKNKPLLIPKYACMAPGTNTSSAMKDSIRGCEKILSVGGDSVLLRLCGKETDEESQDLHAVYNTVTEEQQQVSLPDIFSNGLMARLDRASKKIYYLHNRQINTVNLFKKVTMNKKLSEVCPELTAETSPVMSAFDAESSYMAILFDDSSLLVIDLSSMKSLKLMTLSVDATDIVNLVCTGWDSPAVIATGKCEDAENGKAIKGFVQLFQPSEENNDTIKETPASFSSGLVCLGSSEDFLIGLCNTETSCTLLAIELDELDMVSEMSLSDVMIQMSVAKKQQLAAVLSQKGVVSLVNWKEEKVLSELSTNNPVSCLYVNWSHNLAMLGDSQGQIVLYNIRRNNHCGTFPAHQNSMQRLVGTEENVISLGINKDMKIWAISALTQNITQPHTSCDTSSHSLLGQTQVASLDITLDSLELVTASRDNTVSVWSLTDMSLTRTVDISIVGDKIQVISKESCVALDRTDRRVKIFKLKNGDSAVDCDLPKGALDFTVSQDRSLMCILCQKEKGLMVDVMDLKVGQSKKTFYLKGVPDYETIDICLSANSRFILLRTKVTEADFKEIEASWKKQGSFLPQPHPYRFSAADLTQATGGLMHCMRTMSKIPHLGEVMTPSQGNIMMLTTRRWVLFWDIPTGKCDQKVSKVEKKGMMYRPDWMGQDCKGTTLTITQSVNGKYVALGSEDGYLFVYHTDSGLPVQNMAPSSKHTATVIVTAFSPNNEWVASACRNNTIKIWEASTGEEVFSTRANFEVVSMCFSANSLTLVVSIGSQVTRILVYTLHTGC